MVVDSRKLRGMQIASHAKIVRNSLGWRVPSQSEDKREYFVQIEDRVLCTCPDFEARKKPCKHVWAVRIITHREETREDGTVVSETRSVTYRQDWSAYNAAQVHEKDQFQALLHELCSGLQRPEPARRGRPRIPLADAIFAATFKVYSTVSGRRFMSDLRAARDRGYVGRMPCYNSIFNTLDAEETEAVLDHLIVESARPLKSLESQFACDSSGFMSSRFDRWFDQKYGKTRIERSWVKAHVMCGVRTNVVTALEIHGKNANDAPFLPSLLDTTASVFDVKEVSGDRAYSTNRNLKAIDSIGARPFIAFKGNAAPTRGGVWARVFHYYNLHREEFERHYHMRSNVETTFHMVKAKFGDAVRSKTERAMANEVRAKILCHNICCVIQSVYEFGVEPDLVWGSSGRRGAA